MNFHIFTFKMHFVMYTVQILAWFPRTYVKEFMDLLPAMLNKDTVVEVVTLSMSLCHSSILTNILCSFRSFELFRAVLNMVFSS